ncbi:THIF-type NAD/FAD binding fold-containing protein, partial [Cryptosporidium felis]
INVLIWDNTVVYNSDLAYNFLLDADDIGKNRLECIGKLREMNPMTKVQLANQNEDDPEKLCDDCLIEVDCNGILISLAEIDIIKARNISKKHHSQNKFVSFSISMGTRIFLLFNNNSITLDKILDIEINELIVLLNKIKNIHPYILIVLSLLRRRYHKSTGNNDIQCELLEIIKEVKVKPSIDRDQFLKLYEAFDCFWGKTISPIASIGGGLLCQEVTKFCIGGIEEYFCCIFDMELCEAVTATIKS